MGHRLHRVVVAPERLAQHHLAVAGGAQAQHLQRDALEGVFPVQLLQAVADHLDGVAPVVGVKAVHHLLVFVQQDQLAGGAAGVHADVDPQGVPGLDLRSRQLGQGMAGLPFLPLGVGGKVPLSSVLFGGGRRGGQPLQSLLGGDGRRPAHRQGIQFLHGQRGTQGHDGVGVVGADDLVLGQAQPLGEYLHQGGIVGQGAALKDDRRGHLQALGQAADGLLGDGVESRQGDIGPAGALVEEGLDVGLGKDAAPARDAVHLPALGRQGLELVRGHPQQGGDLVDERAGAAGAAAVHPHIRGGEGAVLLLAEKDDFGVLAAQLDGGAGGGVEGADGGAVGHHFLHIAYAHLVGQRASARAAYRDPHGPACKFGADGVQQAAQGAALLGVVALVAAEQGPAGDPVGQNGLDGGGADVQAKGQTF